MTETVRKKDELTVWKSNGKPQSPQIEVFYGPAQHFGRHGCTQDCVNVLGRLFPPAGYRLMCRLNGGSWNEVSLGQVNGNIRLVRPGDFNIELFVPEYQQVNPQDEIPALVLQPGSNLLELAVFESDTGRELEGTAAAVQVHYQPEQQNSASQASAYIHWEPGVSVCEQAQVVDGYWEVTPEGLHTAEPGYDRLVAIGDTSWQNYQVLTSLTLNSEDGGKGAAGVVIGWKGHYRRNSENPRIGWDHMGAYGHISLTRGGLALRINEFVPQVFPQPVALHTRYWLRMQVETGSLPNETLYRLRVWADGKAEPTRWQLEVKDGHDHAPHGSLLLLAHLCDVTFGDVIVSPLPVLSWRIFVPLVRHH